MAPVGMFDYGITAQGPAPQEWTGSQFYSPMQEMPVLSDGHGGYYYCYYPSGWPYGQHTPTEQVPDMNSMDQVLPEVVAGCEHEAAAMQPPKAGQAAQRQKKQRQGKAKPAQSKECSTHADMLDAASEDKADEAAQAYIQMLADSLLKELRSGSLPRSQLAIASFARMIFQDYCSTRAAQRALETASATEQVALASGLHGRVRSAMQDKNANYAITKAVEVMPGDRIGFIAEELLGYGRDLATHRFGCRVICRILEHLSPRDTNSLSLLEEVLVDAEHLCSQAFGSIVMRHFLEHGPQFRSRVAAALCQNTVSCALARKGSLVVEAAIRYCSPADAGLLAEQLLGDSDDVWTLATGQFGRHVLCFLLTLEGDKSEIRQSTLDALLPMAKELSTSKYGKLVYSALPSSMTIVAAAPSPSRL